MFEIARQIWECSMHKICDQYSEIDSRIHVIHKKNGGLSDARNVGLDYAVGEYIFFRRQ